MILYLDVFIIENFIVNLFLIYITVQTLRSRENIIYMILSAILGTFYAFIMVYTKFLYFFNIPLKIIIAVIMMLIVFRKKDLILIIKSTFVFIFYSMLLAGMCIFLEININQSIYSNFGLISYKYLILSIMIIYIIIHRLINYIRDRNECSSFIYEVDIVMDDYTRNVKAFLDTGNELREPATNLPVMIVEKEYLKGIKINEDEKFIIPYRVVNGFTGELYGFKPKYINVHKKNNVEKRKVIIALCNNGLSELNEYNALLSRGII